MAKQCESQFTREIRKTLEEVCGDRLWIKKIVGNGMMQVGIPDLVGVHQSLFISIENKALQRSSVMGDNRKPFSKHGLFTPDQVENLLTIEKAGGVGIGLLLIKDMQLAVIVPASLAEASKEWTILDIKNYVQQQPERIVPRIKIPGRGQSSWEVKALISWFERYR